MDVFEFIISIVALVLIFVTLWIILLRKRRNDSPIQAEGQYDLDELSRMAESMGARIGTLESILDSEVPDWREQLERGSQ
jgi:phage shock protein B